MADSQEISGIPDRLAAMRIKAGLDPEGIADLLGITPEWYLDLEREAGELESSLEISRIRDLAALLNATMGELVLGNPISGSVQILDFLELARRIRLELGPTQDPAPLEEKTGWDLGSFLKNPETGGWDFSLSFYRDVCGALGLEWRGVLKFCESFRDDSE